MDFDPRPGSRLWGAIIFVPAILLGFLGFLCLLVWSWIGIGWDKHRSKGCHAWGRVLLFVLGIRLEFVGRERLDTDGPLIITFNHQSVLDIVLLACMWPRNGSILYKQEFHRIPIMGRLMKALRMIPVDRGNRAEALASLDKAAGLVRDGNVHLCVAPEGTRSRTGRLAPFKRGPFHLAAQTHAPLLPMVMNGVRELMPYGTWIPRTGRLRLEFLEPLDTTDWRPSEVSTYSARLREMYLEALPDPPESAA